MLYTSPPPWWALFRRQHCARRKDTACASMSDIYVLSASPHRQMAPAHATQPTHTCPAEYMCGVTTAYTFYISCGTRNLIWHRVFARFLDMPLGNLTLSHHHHHHAASTKSGAGGAAVGAGAAAPARNAGGREQAIDLLSDSDDEFGAPPRPAPKRCKKAPTAEELDAQVRAKVDALLESSDGGGCSSSRAATSKEDQAYARRVV